MVTDIPPETDEDETPEVNKEQENRNRGDYLTTSSNKKKSNKKNKGRQQTPDGASRIRGSTSPPTPTTREEHEDLNEEESDDTRQQDEEEDPHDTDNTTDENETRIRHQEEAGIKAFQHHQQKRASTVGENALKGMIRNVVRHQLFRAFKFIKEDDLAYDGTISKYILKRIGRQSSLSNPTFWSTHRGLVKKAIDSKRSTTSMAIKKEVISK